MDDRLRGGIDRGGKDHTLGITEVKTLTAKIPPGLDAQLRTLAKKRRETVSETVRKALDREVQSGVSFAEMAKGHRGMFAGPRDLSSRRGYGTARAR
jgi:predicted transcriptional regulator